MFLQIPSSTILSLLIPSFCQCYQASQSREYSADSQFIGGAWFAHGAWYIIMTRGSFVDTLEYNLFLLRFLCFALLSPSSR